MIYYIYKIENLVNGKVYIGLTNNLLRRKNRHFGDLRRQVHDNKFLQKEFNQYGEDNFSFECIYQGDMTNEEVSEKEQYYIQQYDSYFNGYNQNLGGNFGPANGGTHLTEEDVLNILIIVERVPRSMHWLGEIYNITPTQVSRICQKQNHQHAIDKYENMTKEQKDEYYNKFMHEHNIEELYARQKIQGRRKLTEDQALMSLANEEFKIMPRKELQKIYGIQSKNTLYNLARGDSYKEFYIKYNNLSLEERQNIAAMLRDQYC